jgi:hypothetical protein
MAGPDESETEARTGDLLGLTALVEAGEVEATGTVTAATADSVTVSCDGRLWEAELPTNALISVFAPDALYRISGPVEVVGADVTTAPGSHTERIERRKWSRRRLDMPVVVCASAEGRRVEGVPGRTVDISIGGLCVETLRPVEGEGDPMVIVSLPDGTSVVSATATVDVEELGDGWRYRFAFRDLDPHDAARLTDALS